MSVYALLQEKRTAISGRERQVLHLVSCGLLSKEISSQLYISTHTVHSHIKNLKSKLNARNSAELVRKGFEMNLLNKTRLHASKIELRVLGKDENQTSKPRATKW